MYILKRAIYINHIKFSVYRVKLTDAESKVIWDKGTER
jgi:hypothetical protein